MQQIQFDQHDLMAKLVQMDDSSLDSLDFGVIAFDKDGRVQRYNKFESIAAGLSVDRVIGQNLFLVVAPCMNNFLVAQRFTDARDGNVTLDDTIQYVLTLRMRPTKVRLRLLSIPGAELNYLLVHRL